MTRVQLVAPDGPGARVLTASLGAPLREAGWEVDTRSGYPEAGSWPDEQPGHPDVVVVVVGPTVPDRVALYARLRRVVPSAVIVVLCTSSDSSEVVAALQAGADDCMLEPHHPAVIVARLRAHLRRHPHPPTGAPANRPVAPVSE